MLMPNYDFVCKSCGNSFTELVSIKAKEDGLVKCPRCGSNDIKQVYKSMNFIRKGGECGGNCSGCHGCGA